MAIVKLYVIAILIFTLIISVLMLLLYFYRKKKDSDNKKNTVKRHIATVILGVVIFTGLCTIGFIRFGNALIKKDNNGMESISIIGGADGPTSVFIAGKIGNGEMADYKQINMEIAKSIFEVPGDYIILDVRRPDEFAEGHIPGAINYANEDIIDKEPEVLPDKNQTIYVYCRSGNRSKQASEKLANMGYKNIIEFGGIIDWTGDIEK